MTKPPTFLQLVKAHLVTKQLPVLSGEHDKATGIVVQRTPAPAGHEAVTCRPFRQGYLAMAYPKGFDDAVAELVKTQGVVRSRALDEITLMRAKPTKTKTA